MFRAVPFAILILGGAILLFPQGDRFRPSPDPQPVDALTQSYRLDRAARVEMLREMATRQFASDKEKAECHRDRSREIIEKSFRPYLEAVAEAIVSGQLEELAEEFDQ